MLVSFGVNMFLESRMRKRISKEEWGKDRRKEGKKEKVLKKLYDSRKRRGGIRGELRQ